MAKQSVLKVVALEAPAPAPASPPPPPPSTPSPEAAESAQRATLEFSADEIVNSRNKMVKVVNKAASLFNVNSPAAAVIQKISADLAQDLGGATPENKYALTEASKNWQTMGQHWNAISEAVTKRGTQITGILENFSKVLQTIVGGGEKQQTQAAFNAQEFEGARQQLLGAYKTLQEMFGDAELANSLAAVQAEMKTFQDKSPPQYQKLWNNASILWGEALKNWAALKADIGEHPVHMNSAMKKTFQFWNSVAMGTPTQPAQPLPGAAAEGPPVEQLIEVMRQKAKMQGPDFARQFESIVKSTPPERLKPWLEQQLLGKAANVRLAQLLQITAEGTFSIPSLMLNMDRYYDDTRSTFSGGTEMPELRPHILKATEVLNDVVKQQPRLKPVVDTWNRAASNWAKIDEALEKHGGPMKEALLKAHSMLTALLQEKEQVPAQQGQQQAVAQTVQYKGATYRRVDDE